METLQVQLPPALVQQVHQEAPSDEALNRAVVEAIQMWLERRWQERVKKDETLQTLRQSGLIMDSARQRALAETMMAKLSLPQLPTHAQVEASLSRLRVPLSEEIIAMRGER